jgi:general secretion pathway protein A
MAIELDLVQSQILTKLGFSEDPFSLWPDTRFLYLAKTHLMVLEEALSSLGNGEAVVIHGDTGTGKTLLSIRINELLHRESKYQVAYPTYMQFRSQDDFYFSLIESFGLTKREIIRDPGNKNHVSLNLPVGKNLTRVMLIDQVELLPKNALEMLSLFINSKEFHKNEFPIIFFCTSYATKLIHDASMKARPIQLSFLTVEETGELINFRCMVAGHAPFFSVQSIERIHHESKGNPRKIVLLCQMTLPIIANKKKPFVDLDDVEFVISIARNDRRGY